MINENDVKAAGLIFYRTYLNNIQVFLGQTNATKVDNNIITFKYTILGGRREPNETVIETAIREFKEETCGSFDDMFEQHDFKTILENSICIPIAQSRYNLYIVNLDEHKYLESFFVDPMKRFLVNIKKPDITEFMKEMSGIEWVQYTILFNKFKGSRFVRHVVSNDKNIQTFFNELYIKMLVDNIIESNINKSKIGTQENPLVIKLYDIIIPYAITYFHKQGYQHFEIRKKQYERLKYSNKR